MDLRSHRKIAVLDGRVGYTGSQNLVAAEYIAPDWFLETDEILDSAESLPSCELLTGCEKMARRAARREPKTRE